MQATHFIPDEIAKQHGLREPSTLQAHSNFADEVIGLRQPGQALLTYELADEARDFLRLWRNVLHATHGRHRRWVLGIWAAEALSILGLIMAGSFELWHDCPFEEGPLLSCRDCLGGVMSAWSLGIALVWSLHLELSVLLVSRGFCICPRRKEDVSGGVPQAAVRALVFLSGLLLVGFLTGVGLLVMSAYRCSSQPNPGYLAQPPPQLSPLRSELLTRATLASVVAGPVLIFVGRCSL